MAKENERLIALRKQRKWTQTQVAQKIDVAQCTIHFYEKGLQHPNKVNQIKLAKLFGVTVDYLFYEVHYDSV
ncbi:helix-turn-helix domain-containing protein [Bacillus atrophaeus]|uniref:helix-turn-helix transcriptional regulator n=1 Tax=Bacillus atrophaeus TaxID=1452 RepID=UPI00227E6431|nr:helix-turn-helix transcriptional regulator [Bacillus atrophaeus]MCY9198065.1 helix-turn-helix domain-containing protein [Bacillus atrophaeus]